MSTRAVVPPFDPELQTWTRVGIVAGFVACLAYPVMVFVPIPWHPLVVVLGGAFGPALAVASAGLARVLRARSRSVAAEIAAMANALAGALVTAMIIVQLAINFSSMPAAGDPAKRYVVVRLWDVVLGLDVAFDMFIGLGTVLFGISMLRDRRFGPIVGWAGIVIGGVGILVFNIATFPVPPKDAGLIDPGPITGLWYLVVVLMLIRALRAEGKAALLAEGS